MQKKTTEEGFQNSDGESSVIERNNRNMQNSITEKKENTIRSTMQYVAKSDMTVSDFRNKTKNPKVHVSFWSVNLGPLTIYVDEQDTKDFKINMKRLLDSMDIFEGFAP